MSKLCSDEYIFFFHYIFKKIIIFLSIIKMFNVSGEA